MSRVSRVIKVRGSSSNCCKYKVETNKSSHFVKTSKASCPVKQAVLVDSAGSKRVHRSGSEGHMLEGAKPIDL